MSDPKSDTRPTVVHFTRAVDPEKPVISEEVRKRHELSKRLYPSLNLSAGEYVVRMVRRHPIGLIVPLIAGTFVMAVVLFLILSYGDVVGTDDDSTYTTTYPVVVFGGLIFVIFVAIGMAINSYVYIKNRFILTNESVIQEIQDSLFSKHEQTVSLSNIEDASFTKHGIIQHIFDYGDVRLSTEGDETTYRFSYVANPKKHVAILNNAVEAFKNGRPVSDE